MVLAPVQLAPYEANCLVSLTHGNVGMGQDWYSRKLLRR